MKKRVVLGLVLLIMLSFEVLAYELIETEVNDLKDTILPDESAEFYLKIRNNQDFQDSFKIIKPVVYWDWNLDTEVITVNSGGFAGTNLYFEPFGDKEPGDYGISLDIQSLTNETITTSQLFEIKVVSYDQAITIDFDKAGEINPNKEYLFRIDIINNYDLDMKNITLDFHSAYFDVEKEFSLRPYETVELEFPIEFEGIVSEGDNVVYLDFYRNEELVLEKEDTIDIGYFTDVSGVGAPEEGFLFNSETIVRTNTGNTISHESYTKRLTMFEKLFTSADPEPDTITEEENYFVYGWNFDLEPDQTKTIIIETNYRWFAFYLILGVLLVLYLYYKLKRDLSLDKKIVSMRKDEEGFYNLNVLLTLKNKTLKRIYNVKVMDRLSGRIDDISNFGVYSPTVIKSDSGKSAKIIWNIKGIEKRGEMLLQYTIRYKPHVIRSVPPAIVKYLRRGKAVFVKSNRADIFN